VSTLSPTPRRQPGQGGIRAYRAFSLVEILVTISLLSFIVLGLLMMFNQTQRAFRMSMTQVDVLESGRAVTDMLSRELEQASVSKAEPIYNGATIAYQTTNFFTELGYNIPLLQLLPGSAKNGNTAVQDSRTNVVQNLFFMIRHNQDWVGTGYALVRHDGFHVYSLYRFTATNRPPFAVFNLNGFFRNEYAKAVLAARNNLPVTNMSRIADGIVHLRVRPYTPRGEPLVPFAGASNLVYQLPLGAVQPVENSFGSFATSADGTQLDALNSYFVNDAIPAQVELEIGVLEPNVLSRYRGLGGDPNVDNPVQRSYLSDHAANVHIFRQRVPIRNTDLSVYHYQ